jgi:outer membrane protein assembly factor BamB
MTSLARFRAPTTFAAAAALALGVSACAGDDGKSGEPEPPPTVRSEPDAPEPPPPPEAAIRVLDGDSREPVGGALVALVGLRLVTDSDGVTRFASPAKRTVTARISAPAYAPRTVRLSFRKRLVQRVPLWRPALQWPMYGANPARTQVQPAIRLRPPFRVVWRRHLHGLLEFPAVVWEGVAYVNNSRGWLTALSMKNGRVLWRTRSGRLSASSPAVDPQRRILVTTSMEPGQVSVVSMDTGRVRWRYSIGSRSEPSPVVARGVAYFGAENGNFYALDLDRRRPRWVFRGGVKITSSPALVGKNLYFGDYAGRVFAVSARTGRVVWQGSAGSRVYGTVAVSGGRVFAPSVFSGVTALSARTGHTLWRIPFGVYVYSSPAVFRNRVYFGTYGGLVYCVDAASGHIRWVRSAGGGAVSGAVQIVGGVVYAATLRDHIRAWQWRKGRLLWTFPHGEYVPVSGNGERLLIHGRNQIWAVEPKRRR